MVSPVISERNLSLRNVFLKGSEKYRKEVYLILLIIGYELFLFFIIPIPPEKISLPTLFFRDYLSVFHQFKRTLLSVPIQIVFTSSTVIVKELLLNLLCFMSMVYSAKYSLLWRIGMNTALPTNFFFFTLRLYVCCCQAINAPSCKVLTLHCF